MTNTIQLPLDNEQLQFLIKEAIPVQERTIIKSLQEINGMDATTLISNPKQFTEWTRVICERLEFIGQFKNEYQSVTKTDGFVNIFHLKNLDHINGMVVNYLMEDRGDYPNSTSTARTILGIVQAARFYFSNQFFFSNHY